MQMQVSWHQGKCRGVIMRYVGERNRDIKGEGTLETMTVMHTKSYLPFFLSSAPSSSQTCASYRGNWTAYCGRTFFTYLLQAVQFPPPSNNTQPPFGTTVCSNLAEVRIGQLVYCKGNVGEINCFMDTMQILFILLCTCYKQEELYCARDRRSLLIGPHKANLNVNRAYNPHQITR